VSGVGHETDFTIADFVADRRAPTPSAAAEIVSPDIADLRATLRGLSDRLGSGFGAMLHELRWSLEERRAALGRASPRAQVENARQRLDDLLRRAEAATRHGLHLRAAAVAGLTQTLRAVGPAAVLARGYAVVTRAHDRAVVRSVRQVTDGDRLDVRVADGSFPAEAVAQAE
jgi:exodeoxyribonuclease VII large subunit